MGRSDSKKWKGLTQMNEKVWLENMGRSDTQKREGLTGKNGKGWLKKLEGLNPPKNGYKGLKKWEGLTRKSEMDWFEKWEGLTWKIGKSDSKHIKFTLAPHSRRSNVYVFLSKNCFSYPKRLAKGLNFIPFYYVGQCGFSLGL